MTTVTSTQANPTEALAREYTELTYEQAALNAEARHTPLSDQQQEQLRKAAARIREITVIPPTGYTLPKQAADLVAHAETHGWLTLVQWTPPGYSGQPFVTVQVGRLVQSGEAVDGPGNCWKYSLTWHSRDCAPGKVRKFGQGLACTPDRPATGTAPSVKAIREVIAAHPAPRQVREVRLVDPNGYDAVTDGYKAIVPVGDVPEVRERLLGEAARRHAAEHVYAGFHPRDYRVYVTELP